MKKIVLGLIMVLAMVLFFSGFFDAPENEASALPVRQISPDEEDLKNIIDYHTGGSYEKVPNGTGNNWRLEYVDASRVNPSAPRACENYFLPGNTTIEQKKAIINKEDNEFELAFRRGWDNRYVDLCLIMEAPREPSNLSGQRRAWTGSGKLPVGNKYANIYLSPDRVWLETNRIQLSPNPNNWTSGQIAAEMKRIDKYLQGNVNIHKKMGVAFRIMYEVDGKKQKSMPDFGRTDSFCSMFIEATSNNPVNRSQVIYVERIVSTKNFPWSRGYEFTFATGAEVVEALKARLSYK